MRRMPVMQTRSTNPQYKRAPPDSMAQAIESGSKTRPRFGFATMNDSMDGIIQRMLGKALIRSKLPGGACFPETGDQDFSFFTTRKPDLPLPFALRTV